LADDRRDGDRRSYYRDGDKVARAKVMELLDNSPFICKQIRRRPAQKMKVDAASFLATVERHNNACAQGLEREPEPGAAQARSRSTRRRSTPLRSSLARKNFGRGED
jgi:hypothetical protein